MTFRRIVFVATLTTVSSNAVADQNLARSAILAASAPGVTPANLADGDLDTLWMPGEKKVQEAWMELTWPSPVTAGAVVIRQIGDGGAHAGLESAVIEVFSDQAWHQVGVLRSPVPVYAAVEFQPRLVSRIRVSSMRGLLRIREIEVYAGSDQLYVDVRGDATGNIIGVVADPWGTAGYAADVNLSGMAGGRPWTAEVTSETTGEFSVPRPAGLAGPVRVVARAGSRVRELTVDAGDVHQGLVPRPVDKSCTLSLDGKWRFRMDPPRGFEKQDFNDTEWTEINVPSHWIMHGFHSDSGVAGYRRKVIAPLAWKGRRVRLAFDGVYSGAEVWVNGIRAGSHLGGANPFQLDVTSMLRWGGSNVIAVRVSEHTPASDELDHMSQYADFPLAGIMRRTYLFSTSPVHVARLHLNPSFDANRHDAMLALDVTVVNESDVAERDARADFTLSSPDGAVAASAALTGIALAPWETVRKTVEIRVRSPKQWEAEHPNLYLLRTAVSVGGRTVETVESRTGFRDVAVRGTGFFINGVPVKLKGTCHHDSHPLMGRAVTPELERKDLDLIKEANLNAVRTSHYPPLPELLDAADEKGVYVEDEASFCWVGNSYDLRLAALAKQFTGELVERDRDHPSVVIWSSGNESLWGPILLEAEGLIRASDTTRPVVGSWRRDHFDMIVHHNPMDIPLLREYAGVSKPINWDESLGIFQGIWGDGKEIWRDPGYRDYYVQPLKPILEEFWKSRVAQGSFIWAWSDDLFAVPWRSSEFGRDATPWHTQSAIYGMPGRGIAGDAPWGVVDGWRRPKPEFWHTKNLHSPVCVRTTKLEQGSPMRIEVENRYSFTALSELAITWELDGQKGEIHSGIAPLSSGVLEISPGFVARPGSELVLRFRDAWGRTVQTAAVRIGKAPEPSISPGSPLRIAEENTLAGHMLRVIGDGFEVGFSRGSGVIRRAVAGGHAVLLSGPSLHILPADPAASDVPVPEAWTLTSFDAETSGDRALVSVCGEYPDFAGTYQTTVDASGEIVATYDFVYSGKALLAREIGLKLGLPLSMDTLRWERNGEWTWYPEDHIGRNRGTTHAHADHPSSVPPTWAFALDDSMLGTNDFRSQKRNFTKGSLTDINGYGVALASDGSQHLRALLESDRIGVHVNDWFGGTWSRDEWRHFGKGKQIAPGDRLQGTIRFRLLAPKAVVDATASGRPARDHRPQ